MHLTKGKALLNLTKSLSITTQARNSISYNIHQKLENLAIDNNNKTSFSRFYSTSTNPQNLPHFPVPSLDETLTKFLKTIEVHLNDTELQQTKQEIEKFRNGIGKELQNLLEKDAQKNDNWLAKRWLRHAYLTYRDPVCVFSSPGMAFPSKQSLSYEDYLKYTSKLIYGALRFKNMIDKNEIPVEKMGKFELDMSQYKKVFGTCRIPGLKEDTLEYYPDSKHIAVVYKNQFYKVPVYSNEGIILHSDEIYEQLKIIFSDRIDMNVKPIGILSSDNRDAWAVAYNELISDPENKKTIQEIQKSLFIVCLDKEVPVHHGKNDMTVTSEQLIHGGGSHQNAGNRWFDKTIQLITNRNGVNGFCYEHSPAEGQPIAIMTDFIIKSLSDKMLTENADVKRYEKPNKLNVKITPKIENAIGQASNNVNKLAQDLHMEVLHFKTYGKEFIKTQKLSPDSYLQMAMQYAFYKLHKVPAAHYESAHLRMYNNGRTETIRSCSNESIAFAKSMIDNNCSNEIRVKCLREAVNAHRSYTQMALQGKGVDRHLLGLKLMALENNIPVPELYKTPGFVKSSHFRLSTSQVASRYEAFMCYGPLTNDGYGCCYNPRAHDMIFAISSWHSNPETCSVKFRKSMEEALSDMMELLCQQSETAMKSKL